MLKSIIIRNDYDALYAAIKRERCKSILLVTDRFFEKLLLADKIKAIEKICECKMSVFDDLQPNPKYDSVVRGVEFFNRHKCDAVIAVGGGSAIDVAKCIKLYAYADHGKSYLTQAIDSNDIFFITIPTTAGTGSEATKFAVIYKDGEKLSITDDRFIPDVVLFDDSALYTLPVYQRKCSMLDAFFHAAESFWSVNSTTESRKISKKVIEEITDGYKNYIAGGNKNCEKMFTAAHKAGQAINITQTTAGHAMSYKLTSLFGLPHGHAVALCNGGLIDFMVDNIDLCVDVRGKEFLTDIFMELSQCLGGTTVYDLPHIINDFIGKMNLSVPFATKEQIEILSKSVNPIRLKNNPIKLTESSAKQIYEKILNHA